MEKEAAEEGEEPEPPEPGGVAVVEPDAEEDAELRLAREAEAGAEAALVAEVGAGDPEDGVAASAAEGVTAAATDGSAATFLAGSGLEDPATGLELTGTAVTGMTERDASDPEPWTGVLPPAPEALDRVLDRGWAMAEGVEIGADEERDSERASAIR